MPAQNHQSYNEELQRCVYTLEYVEKNLEATTEKKQRVDGYLDKVKKHFNSESSQDYIDVIINTTLQSSMDLKLRNLITARSKPYFARIDFRELDKAVGEKLYIGKMCLMRDEDQEMVIVDWRAPIANLYYEGRLGSADYVSPGGNINGELMLKRQFSINGGILREIFDIDITTSDEFLQSHLGANADNRLKDIVSTIQAEQNKIIRADMWTPLIVQGAAGSGKTTIALHRIAFLIYSYEKSFKPENFMIIAPNKLFLNYISDVLPELGVERVLQTTFEEFALEIIGKKLKIRDANEKLIAFANYNATQEEHSKNEQVRKGSELKSSMLFKEILDDYINEVEQSFIPAEDFKLANVVLFKYEELQKLFLKDYKNWPIMQRLQEIKKHLNNKLKAKKDLVINHFQDEHYERIDKLKLKMGDCEERQKLIIKLIDEKNETISKIETHAKKAVSEYMGKISKIAPFQYYKDFIDKYLAKCPPERADKELLKFVSSYSSGIIKSGYVEIEDLAPIIYLKYLIYGMDEKIPVKHIVIDEAQDFSVFQFYVLRKIIKDSSFTILGDLCQGIHSYKGTRDWKDITEYVFDDRKSVLLTLEQSYRTTVEIMEAANKVISRFEYGKAYKAKPVIRHGEKVWVLKKDSIKEVAADIIERIRELKANSFNTIAIICKTPEECKEILPYLKAQEDSTYVITGKEDVYKSGIVIVPSHLAKGLEFDAVMIANAASDRYRDNELDIKLLYVSMTRPLHNLYIYYCGEPSPLLEGI